MCTYMRIAYILFCCFYVKACSANLRGTNSHYGSPHVKMARISGTKCIKNLVDTYCIDIIHLYTLYYAIFLISKDK